MHDDAGSDLDSFELYILNGWFEPTDLPLTIQEKAYLDEQSRNKVIRSMRHPIAIRLDSVDITLDCVSPTCRLLSEAIHRRPGHFINWRSIRHSELYSLRHLRALNDRVARKIMSQIENKFLHSTVDKLIEQEQLTFDASSHSWQLDPELIVLPQVRARRYKRDNRNFHGLNRAQSKRRLRPAGISTGSTSRSSAVW